MSCGQGLWGAREVPASGSTWHTWRPAALIPPRPAHWRPFLPAGESVDTGPAAVLAGLAHPSPQRRSSQEEEGADMSQDRPSLV